jgi:hypothetical protein
MRWIPIIAIVPLLAACAATKQQTNAYGCREVRLEGDFMIFVALGKGWPPPEPPHVCGRVLERDTVALIERRVRAHVTGIRCGPLFGPIPGARMFPVATCLVRITSDRCGLWLSSSWPDRHVSQANAALDTACRNLGLP